MARFVGSCHICRQDNIGQIYFQAAHHIAGNHAIRVQRCIFVYVCIQRASCLLDRSIRSKRYRDLAGFPTCCDLGIYIIRHQLHRLHRSHIPKHQTHLRRRTCRECSTFRNHKVAQIGHHQLFLNTLAICIAKHHCNWIIGAAFQICIRKRCHKLDIQNLHRGIAEHWQCNRLILYGCSGGNGEMLQKLPGTARCIYRIAINTCHIYLSIDIAAGRNQNAGNIFYIALVKGQFQYVTRLNGLILLICNIDISGRKHLAATTYSRILQCNSNISVFCNKVCCFGFIPQHQVDLLLICLRTLNVAGQRIEFHIGISMLAIQIEGVDHNTGSNLLHDHMIDIRVYHIGGLRFHINLIQRTHSGSCQSVHGIDGLTFSICQLVKTLSTGFQYTAVAVGILCTNINIKRAGSIIGHIYKDIQNIILGIRHAGYRTDPCICLCIQLDSFMFAKINLLINVAIGGQEEFKCRNLIHCVLTQILGCPQAHIFILIIDLQKSGFHHQGSRYICNLQRPAVKTLHIQGKLSKFCYIRNANNKSIRMVFPEHKAVVRNRQGCSGASCSTVIQINRCFVSIVIHSTNDIKSKLLTFSLLVVVLQSSFHGAIEGTAIAAIGINADSHEEFQVQCIGTVGNRINARNIGFLTALLTGDRIACSLVLIVNSDPAYILNHPFLRYATAIVTADTNLGDIQLIIGIAILGNIIRNDMNRYQFTIVIIGRYDKALRAAGTETIST